MGHSRVSYDSCVFKVIRWSRGSLSVAIILDYSILGENGTAFPEVGRLSFLLFCVYR